MPISLYDILKGKLSFLVYNKSELLSNIAIQLISIKTYCLSAYEGRSFGKELALLLKYININSACKENKERGSCGNGRLLIHLYYSAVTGNRKQVLTGSSESCEHKCR